VTPGRTRWALCLAGLVLAVWPLAASAREPQPSPSPHAPPAPLAPVPTARAAAPPPADLQWRSYADAREVLLRNVAAIVRVMPENRRDVAFATLNSGPLEALQPRLAGSRLIIDGGLAHKIQSCRERRGDDFAVSVARRGWVEEAALPIIYLRVPQDVQLQAGGAVSLWMTPAQSAHVGLSACGEADFERIAGASEFAVSGQVMNLRVYDVGSGEFSVANSGDVSIGLVRNGLTVSVAGSGDVNALRVDGPIQIAVQGSGDIDIRDGRASIMSVAVMGTGDVNFGGEAERLDAAVFGTGDVHVRRVSGDVSRRVFGPGEVTVGP
jgi:Putative auto-transporter adhesin, head GIN domain